MIGHRWTTLALALVALGGLCGCANTGQPEDRNAIPEPGNQYTGLAGQQAAIMVWTDWRTRTDYSRLQLDLAKALQERIEPRLTEEAKDKDKEKAPPKPLVQFINPASVVRYQREHPEIEGLPITEVAPKLGVPRVIYIEIENFQTHSADSIMLLKGEAKATLRVVEVADGKAKVVLEERDIEVKYPPDAPAGVLASDKVTLRTIYDGTVKRLSEALGVWFAKPKKA